jgi:hypothetical protein
VASSEHAVAVHDEDREEHGQAELLEVSRDGLHHIVGCGRDEDNHHELDGVEERVEEKSEDVREEVES